jgi:hypothetical protein
MWARREVGRRWKALVVLGLLGGLVGGLALAAVAGARRTDTAYQRFREATGRSDAIVFGTLIGLFPADYAPVRALPEVEDAGEFTLAPLEVKEPPLGQLAPNDDRLYRTVNRPLLVAGRLPDPERADEILVDRQATKLGLGIGDRVTIQTSTELFNPAVPIGSGPSFEVTIVGVGDSNMSFAFAGDEAGFVPSAALLAQHPEIPRAGNLVVRLRPGTDVAAFGRRAAEAMGVPPIPVRDLAEDTERVTHGTDLGRAALLLFAGAVALAGLVLVGQAVARTVYSLAEPADALRAVGFTRNGLVAGLLAPLSLAAATGLVTATGTAIALSRLFPPGLAGRLEPDRGVHADWLVIGPGSVGVGLSVLAGASVAALRATSARRPLPEGGRRALWMVLGRRAPLPAMIGAALALEKGDGRRALPVRPALASATAAVLGVVGAFGLLHGIDGALSHPERSGQFWAAEVTVDRDSKPGTLAALVGSDQVAAVTVLRFVDTDVDGSSVVTYALEPAKGSRSFTVIEGRGLAGPDDVVLGPSTARALGRKVGDQVRVGGPNGRDLRLVGLGLLPQTPHFGFDQGAWVSPQELDALSPPPDPEGPSEETVLVSFVPQLAATAGVARLTEELGPAAGVEPASIPADVGYLRNVRSLPKALAGFLVFLGLGALAHVLATAVRRRRQDLAVLRAIGFRPLQLASCVAWQAATVALVALIIGIPLGIAAGRWSWRWVAETTPLLYVPPLAATVVILSVPVTLVLANVMAALPARRAARLRPADVLRAE